MRHRIVALSLIRNKDTAELCSVLIGNYFPMVNLLPVQEHYDVKDTLQRLKNVRHMKTIVLLVDHDSLSRRCLKLARYYNRRKLAGRFAQVKVLVVGYQEDQLDFAKVWGVRQDCSFICKPVSREDLGMTGVFA